MKVRAAVLAVALVVCLNGCYRRTGSVVVGSKSGTEQIVLGEIISQHLERRLGEPVSRRLGNGDTELLHQSMQGGEVDVYPEYTGTALRNIFRLSMEHDPKTVFERVRDLYEAQYQIVCLPPLGFDSAISIAVLTSQADSLKLQKLSDAEMNTAGWKLAYAGDFGSRQDGLPQLTSGYRLPLRAAPVLLERVELFQALSSKMADMVVVRTTDGSLKNLDARLLKDDRLVFPPYEAFVAVRAVALSAHPKLRAALAELSGKVDTETMQRLNAEVDVNHKEPAAVAHDFLKRLAL